MQVIGYLSSKEVLHDFVSDIEGRMLDHISPTFAAEFSKKQSWDNFIDNPQLLRSTLETELKSFDPFLKARPNGPRVENRVHRQPPRGPYNGRTSPSPRGKFTNKGPASHHLDDVISRISLLDANNIPIINATSDTETVHSRAIKINNTIIGWVTLNKHSFQTNPITNLYLSKQLEVNYWVGSIGVVIAAIFSYFLSRHITAPITRLSQGAEQIAQRDFSTRIKVSTNDEFRDLANSVNNISKALDKFDTQQKQWLMDISHELRTPLTILDGELEALSDGVSPLNNQAIHSLQEEVTLIMRLVHDLHDLTVIDKIAFECQQDDINLTELISQQLNKFSVKFTNKNIALVKLFLKEDIFVKGDQARLCQVIQNILENGLRYINTPGSLKVTSEISQQMVYLCFHDSGPGVAKTALPKLFNRLYRTDDSRNRKTGGAGLGLAICKNIIEAHSGEIYATQNIYGGLSIHIHLPINHERKL